MKPTIEWMSQTFDEYNTKYFGGKLRRPKFALLRNKDYWGYYKPDGYVNRFTRKFDQTGPGIIYLNGLFSREEKSLISTLLHEMIHMYIYTIKKIEPRNQHGEEFYEIANFINRDGWNISEENEMTSNDILDDENNDEINDRASYTICILEHLNGNIGNYWGLIIKNDNIQEVISKAKTLNGYKVSKIYIYECYSDLSNLLSNIKNLSGFSGNNIGEIFNKISISSRTRLNNNNLKLIDTINI